ncbi:hypothetical protein BJ170DRAFT_620201 [Xylariales sp. AK1849]|nr:hypothetical protein BJ170DRAFT_620201 [Xylariales sp. AK1849]
MAPPNHDILTDDYVADLLAKEAADCNIKYSAMGIDAFNKSAKRPARHPTPNTRFLNNIVRNTDNHNRALLAQERADSQARLRDLEGSEEKKRQAEKERSSRLRPAPADTRKRMLGDIAAIIGGTSKRRRNDDAEYRADDHVESESRWSKRPKSGRDDLEGRRRSGSRQDGHVRPDAVSKGRSARKELFAEHGRKRDFTSRGGEDMETSRSRGDRLRSGEPERPGKDSRGKLKSGHLSAQEAAQSEADRRARDRQGRRSRDLFDDKKPRHHTSSMRLESDTHTSPHETQYSSDSDPLDDIIGPKPASPVRRRGRGTMSGSSGMDNRFASGYNPKSDVALDHDQEDDDWGTALEALKDRQRWKEQGADRLRAAGFTDEQVKKWEKGDDKDEDDVRWTKKGVQREWDRGKTLVEMGDGSSV